MKVLFVTHYSELMGANRAMLTLIKCLIKSFSVDAKVVMPTEGPLCDELEKMGVEYYIIPMYWWLRKTYSWDKGFVRLLDYCNKQRRNFCYVLKSYNKLKKEQFDLVYSNSVVINTGWMISLILRLPHIWHFRESLHQFSFRFPHLWGQLIINNGSTKYYILISNFLRNTYKTFLPSEGVELVYDGVEVAGDEVYQHKSNTENIKTIYDVCVVGAVAEQKNQLDVINTIPLLKKKGLSVKLHIVGPIDEDYKKECDAIIASNGINDSVVYYGMQNDVSSIVKRMDLCVMPSRDEAFGLVTVEYMLQRKPVVASKSGANEELVIDGINGLCYDLHNYEQLADKMELLLLDKKLSEKYGQAGYDIAVNNFSSMKNAENIYKIFEKAVNGI